jgi:uncharacterized membrane protein
MNADQRTGTTETARLDNFVDGAFAFAITLLVISGSSVPRDLPALLHALGGVPAFACCFMQLALFWHGHVRWRDQVRLSDRGSLLLSLLLVFFALIFVYPLHMVFASFFWAISGGALSMDFAISIDGLGDFKTLFVVYGLAYACMAGTMAALFGHAARHARGLPRAARIEVSVGMVQWLYSAAVGLLSVLLAWLIPLGGKPAWVMLPGFCYALLGATGTLVDAWRRRLERVLPP